MRYLILFLVLVNVVVFLLPKESQRTIHSYSRGDAEVPMLVRLDEQADGLSKTALVKPGPALRGGVADVAPVVVAGVPSEPLDQADPSGAAHAEEAQINNDDAAAQAAFDALEQQGRFDKTDAGKASGGITTIEPASSGAISRGPLRCFSLGPFRNKEQASELMAKMVKKGIKPALRTAKVKEPSAYWVYLPSYPSREKAVEAVDRLEAMGFDDYFIVGDAKYNNAISLGLFSRKSGSRQRVKDLEEMGFEAKVETRYAENEVYWIDYASHGVMDWQPLYRGYEGGNKIQNEKRDCE